MKYVYLLIAALLVLGCKNQNTTIPVNVEALFVHEIIPIFESKCIGCHGEDKNKIEGGLNLNDYQNLLAGGDSGKPSIIPGNPKESLLVHAINRETEEYAMPPKEGDKLSPLDIQIIEKWIEGGAPWPNPEKITEISSDTMWTYGNRVKVSTSGGLSKVWNNRKYEKENLWAYYPLSQPKVPYNVSNSDTEHPIDLFLKEKRMLLGLSTTNATSKRLLFRRASIDLTGLPPSPSDLSTFLLDNDEDAYAKLIERLMDSPQYGEQLGRHWLDVVRYADSGGFSNDYMRPNAWRYRDYVIRSFNQDKPYNQFVMEQLAGDEIDPKNAEMLIATGFLRMGPWEHTSMTVAAETRQFFLDDVTNIVGETFLATPLNCAKCHDHKYDPIPTKDYYGIQAVFATTQFANIEADFLDVENVLISNSEKQRIFELINKTENEQKRLVDKEEMEAKRWYIENGMKYLTKSLRRKLPEGQQPPRYYGLSFDELGYRKVLSKRKQILKVNAQRFEPVVYSVYNGSTRVSMSHQSQLIPDNMTGELPSTNILAGGSIYAPLEPVNPGVLSVASSFLSDGDHEIDRKVNISNGFSNRRLDFAKWLTDPKNPIFARTIVNRIWQHHFGLGISATPNNFGATGGKPSHPELLDWLANYFIENSYSIKKLHKLIMTSNAYQLSSEHSDMDKIKQLDPDNKFLCYFNPRRLEAEEIKDAMLFVSGEINLKVGGFPVRPEINQEVALQPVHTMGSIAPAYQPSITPEERNRRSIYAEKFRTLIDPDLEVFNKPGTDLSCEQRSESTVTPQVFTLLNGKNTRTRSIALADKLMKKAENDVDLINSAIELIWSRAPTEAELLKAQEYLAKMIEYHLEHESVKEIYPKTIKREMFEEMTGEHFEYIEELDIYDAYIPDLQPTDVDEKTRAFADMIAVLFNSNEFVYVY
jgi:hypothetical protein